MASITLTLPVNAPKRKQFRLDDLLSDTSESSADEISVEHLHHKAAWIRDDLEPNVARHGPDWLKPDQVVHVFSLLEQLRHSQIPVETIRSSRIHLAVLTLTSPGTRWPKTVVELAEKVTLDWSKTCGDINAIGIDLYEPGGRLHGICLPTDLTKEVLEVK